MRCTAVLLALTTCACGSAATGVPEPGPPAPVLEWDCGRPLNICVVEQGQLREVSTDYDVITGDTLVEGKTFSHVYTLTSDYGAAARWFNRREPIRFGGRVHRQAGLPRIFGSDEVVRIGEYRGVSVFAPRDTVRYPGDRVYVSVRTGCEFQGFDPQG